MSATPPNEVMIAMLDRLDNAHLQGLVAYAQNRMKANTETARTALLAEFEEKAAAVGLSAAQLFGSPAQATKGTAASKRSAGATSAKEPGAVKFQSPTGQTWTGRGRKPLWLTAAEAAGEEIESFRTAA